MKGVLRFLFILTLLIHTSDLVFSQASKEIIMLEGRKYYLHEVKKGETITSICEAYRVDKKELMISNSEILYGLKAGETIKIPVQKIEEQKPSKKRKERKKKKRKEKKDGIAPSDEYILHKVKRGETAFSLSRKYQVHVNEIYFLNPEAKKGLKKGEVIKIPLKKEEPGQDSHTEILDNRFIYHEVKSGETLYSISRKYDCPVSEILKLNPQSQGVLSLNSIIKIKKKEIAKNEISGSDFFTHRIEKGETFFRLEREYGVKARELKALNPALADGLKTGLTIKIPKVKIPEAKVAPINEDKFFYVEVKKGETLYAISKAHNIKIRDLKEINPVLKRRGLAEGDKLLIPKKEEITDNFPTKKAKTKRERKVEVPQMVKIEAPIPELPEACKNYNYQETQDTFQVALFLPLFLDANDTINTVQVTPDPEEFEQWQTLHQNDTLKYPYQYEIRENKIVYSKSRGFLNFYEGFLLAVDSLKTLGLNTKLYVYDTTMGKGKIDSLAQLPEFLSLDLIVGPIYGKNQSTIAQLAYKNRIPMVSPLDDNGELLRKNPFYFQVRPNKQCRIKYSADFIGDEFFDANFIVLTNGNWKHLDEAKLVDLCREKLFSTGFYEQSHEPLFHQIDLKEDGFFGLEHIMDPLRENVVIVPSSNEAQVNVAVSNLNSLTERFKITLVGMHEYARFRSISSENLHHVNMYYLSPYHVDYTDLQINKFIGTYRKTFFTEPNQYSFQGYDVAYYFLSALHQYGKRFVDCLPFIKVDLLQAEYNFQRASQFGGFMNTSLHLLNYDRNYNIQCDGKIGNTPVYFIEETADKEAVKDSILQQNPPTIFDKNIELRY